jgi:cation-transporting ATPase E
MSTKLAYPIELKQMNVIEFLAIGIPAFILALEYNNNRIKGSFFMNVMKNALPGALVIIFNFVMLFLLQDSLGIGTKTLSTMSLVVTTFAFLVVLKRICTPFNLLRRLLFGVMTLGFLACITFTPIRDFLELVSLDVPQLLLVALLVVLTNTLIDFLIKLPSTLSSFIREKLRFKKIKIVLVEKDKTSKGKN